MLFSHMLRSAPFFLGLIPFLFQGADAHLPGKLQLLSNFLKPFF